MPKELKHIFLDFDETLFDHHAFQVWIDGELHKLGHLPEGLGSFHASSDDYHEVLSTKPLHRLYKHRQHINDRTTQTWAEFEPTISRLASEQKRDFCYLDAHKAIDFLMNLNLDLRILTFGHDEYQHFKINSCSYLQARKLPVHVVTEHKSIYLKHQFPHDLGALVDDKYPLKLPNNWHHIWIDRQSQLDQPTFVTVTETKISSLSQLPLLFSSSSLVRQNQAK